MVARTRLSVKFIRTLLVVHTLHSCVTLLGDGVLPFEVCVLFIVLYNECVQNGV
jgi:hypothetical protein